MKPQLTEEEVVQGTPLSLRPDILVPHKDDFESLLNLDSVRQVAQLVLLCIAGNLIVDLRELLVDKVIAQF